MRLKWYGTATILLESGNTRLLFDPYCKPLASSAPVPLAEARTADAVFITHPHLDHFRDIDAFSEGKRPVYVSAKGLSIARRNGLQTGCMREIAANETVRVGPFTVLTYPALHCAFDAATVLRVLFSPRTWRHFNDAVALLKETKRYRIRRSEVLAFSVSDGHKQVLLFGSAGMAEGAVYPQGADLLVFPYQGRARMDRELIPFLDKLRPKAVTVDHFDDAFPPITRRVDTRRFRPTVQNRLPSAKAFVPQENVWYEV